MTLRDEKEGMEAKVKVLGIYRGMMRPYPHPWSTNGIEVRYDCSFWFVGY